MRFLLGWVPVGWATLSLVMILVSDVVTAGMSNTSPVPRPLLIALIGDVGIYLLMGQILQFKAHEFWGGLLESTPEQQTSSRRILRICALVLLGGSIGLLFAAETGNVLPPAATVTRAAYVALLAYAAFSSLVLFLYGLLGQEAVIGHTGVLYSLLRPFARKV